jgi:nicotinate dehydrogenase subunit A
VTTSLVVNGQPHHCAADPGTALLHVLRNELGLNGPKYGCGLGECGACTVLIGGRAARACCTPVSQVGTQEIITLEGLAGDSGLDPVQTAFIAAQATQCGYCLNGMIVTVKALLLLHKPVTGAEIARALRFNLCRCGAHVEIMRAACAACGVDPDPPA